MSKLKDIFNKLFPTETHIVLDTPRERATARIKCHDCKRLGRIKFYDSFWDCEVPVGWMQVWTGFRYLYLCDECVIKRRNWGRQFLER